MHGHLRLTSPDDSVPMRELWSRALAGATDFHQARRVLPELNEVDHAITVGAFDSTGRMLSVLRAYALASAPDLAPHTELWSRMPPLLPTLLLKYAATRPEYQQRGLNSLLRFHLLRTAANAGFASTCGLMPSQGSRARALSEIGYAAFGEIAQVDGLVARTGAWRLFVLDLSTPEPLNRLRAMTTEVGRHFIWSGPPPRWPCEAGSRGSARGRVDGPSPLGEPR